MLQWGREESKMVQKFKTFKRFSCYIEPGLQKDDMVTLTVKLIFNTAIANEVKDFDNFEVFSHLGVENKAYLVHGSDKFYSSKTGALF
jgi:hypothetical protein